MSNKKTALARSGKADEIKQVNDTTKTRIMSMLGCQKVTREELSRCLGINDRAVRQAISELRREGYNICSDSSGSGYWLGSPEETRKTIAQYRRRAITCLKTAIDMEKRLELEGQVEADVLL